MDDTGSGGYCKQFGRVAAGKCNDDSADVPFSMTNRGFLLLCRGYCKQFDTAAAGKCDDGSANAPPQLVLVSGEPSPIHSRSPDAFWWLLTDTLEDNLQRPEAPALELSLWHRSRSARMSGVDSWTV